MWLRPPSSKYESQLRSALKCEKLLALDLGAPSEVDRPFEIKYSCEGYGLGSTQGDTARVDVQFSSQLPQVPDDRDKEKGGSEDYFLAGPPSIEGRLVVMPPRRASNSSSYRSFGMSNWGPSS